jgi:hypothetical protein
MGHRPLSTVHPIELQLEFVEKVRSLDALL